MSILVAGGAGYIGSHTAMALIEKGEHVIVVDNLCKGHKSAIEILNCKFYEGDLHDDELLDRIFTENNIDSVIDFAADSLVGESVNEPIKYYLNNVGSTLNLLKKMVEHKIKYIVFSSTAATYGETENIPILETEKTIPTNPYGETKLAVEKALKWIDNAGALKYTALRYFNAAGAHISGKIGEDHAPETHLIPIILDVALGKKDAISIFGNDYPTADGTCIRDYVHVTDLANAHILALERLRNGGESRIYNLGNGEGFSVKEVVNVAKKVTGNALNCIIAPRRAGDPATLIASSEKAQNELNWKPQYNSLETIIETAWKWHKSHPNGYNDK